MLLVTACWRLCSRIWHNGVRLGLNAQVVNTDVSLSTAKTCFRNVAGKPFITETHWCDEEPVRRGRNAPTACFIVRGSLQQEIRPKVPRSRPA